MKILLQDEHLIAVNKPPGWLTVPGRGEDKQDCLHARVTDFCSNALLVHRLDMGTSGVVIFARSKEVQRALNFQFEKRQVTKRYIAWVEGDLRPDAGLVEYPLRKDLSQKLPPKHLVDCIRGKSAETRWRVLERCSDMTLLQLFPKTGRSHQLRVHMQSIGHPIVGDPIYGKKGARLLLHACYLDFFHPLLNKKIVIECAPDF